MSKKGRLSRHRRKRPVRTVETAPTQASPVTERPRITVTRYNTHECLEQQLNRLEDLPALLKNQHIVWVNVEGLDHTETIHEIGRMFELHPLSLEDVLHVHQRAKVEAYEDHLFIVGRMVARLDPLHIEQMSIYLGRTYVLTFQEGFPGDCLDNVRTQLRQNYLRAGQRGADYLVYLILDAVVDSYFPMSELLANRLDELDDQMSKQQDQLHIAVIHELRSDLLLLRRSIWPHREAVNSLIRDSSDWIGEETRVYLRDTYDHTLQLIDLVETYREACADLRDFLLTSLSNRTNDIMKVLTIIATIFIPLSFIAGVYGMNFPHIPEFGWRYGYAWAWAWMVTVAAALLAAFWRRGWFK